MGLLTVGTPLTRKQIAQQKFDVKRRGIQQFINKHRIVRYVRGDSDLWGDETEFILIKFDHRKKQVKALLHAGDILNEISLNPDLVVETWHPEYANYMLEGIPTKPYNGLFDCFSNVEENLRRRRKEIQRLLKCDEAVISIGNFPLTGCFDFRKMGLLTVGTPLTRKQIAQQKFDIKRRGIQQFINKHRIVRYVRGDSDLWGDETEFILIKFDHRKKQVKALLHAGDILNEISLNPDLVVETWHPEYANYMLEGIPTKPYNGLFDCFSNVEENLRRRRKEIQRLLKCDEAVISIGNFPLTGCFDFSFPSIEPPNPLNSVSKSIFLSDGVIYNHFHFTTITHNMTDRRGKLFANVPIFRDENTPTPFTDEFDGRHYTNFDIEHRKSNHIYLDSFPFGSSCCCLQMTFQTKDLTEATKLFDQFVCISPIILALSASTPIFRGYLADVDCRWDAMRDCVDDRTDSERSKVNSDSNQTFIPTLRCGSAVTYLSSENQEFNDFVVPFCQDAYKKFLQAGVDELLAKHMAHFFLQDPIQICKEDLDLTDEESSEIFKGFHMLHWRTVRLKLPPSDKSSGWKVEFRPTEVQMTDFQNAAFAVFTFLLSRLILEDKMNMVISITKVFENMKIAQKRDAVLSDRFWTNVTTGSSTENVQLTIDEIINGNRQTGWVGLTPIIKDWLNTHKELGENERQRIQLYIDFISKRANGDEKTVAKWMREFVAEHPEYKKDSVVSQRIAYDLLKEIHEISLK